MNILSFKNKHNAHTLKQLQVLLDFINTSQASTLSTVELTQDYVRLQNSETGTLMKVNIGWVSISVWGLLLQENPLLCFTKVHETVRPHIL